MNPKTIRHVVLDGHSLTFEEFIAVARFGAKVELAVETLKLTVSVLGKSNEAAASDLGVAALSLRAGIQGAWLNVLINIGSLKDKELAGEFRAKGEALLAEALPLADQIYEKVLTMV